MAKSDVRIDFGPPIWVSKITSYTFKINDTDVVYIKSFVCPGETIPDVTDDEFLECTLRICDRFHKEYTKWFPGRKTTVDVIMKNLKHTWSFNGSPDLDDGVEYQSIWKPTAFCFGGTLAEIQWSLIDVSGISSKELKETELAELPCSSDTPSLNIQIETRQNYRKRIRQARLKAALAELKARKMAEAYYRRYEKVDDSSNSELEESDLEEDSEDAS